MSWIIRSWALVRVMLVSLRFMVGVVLTGAVSLLWGQESTMNKPTYRTVSPYIGGVVSAYRGVDFSSKGRYPWK